MYRNCIFWFVGFVFISVKAEIGNVSELQCDDYNLVYENMECFIEEPIDSILQISNFLCEWDSHFQKLTDEDQKAAHKIIKKRIKDLHRQSRFEEYIMMSQFMVDHSLLNGYDYQASLYYDNLAIANRALGKVTTSMNMSLKSREHAFLGKNYRGAFWSSISLSIIFREIEEFEKAKFYLEESRVYIDSLKETSESFSEVSEAKYLSAYYLCSAPISRSLKNLVQGRELLDSAIFYAKRIPRKTRLGKCYSTKADYYNDKDSLEVRLDLILSAIDINLEEEDRVFYGYNVAYDGYLHYLKGDYKTAERKLLEGRSIANEFDISSHIEEAEGYLVMLYEDIGEHEKAFNALKLQQEISDQTFGKSNTKKIFELELKASQDRIESELKALSQEKKIQALELEREKQLKLFLSLGFLGLLSFGSFLAYRYSRNQKVKNEIIQQRLIDEMRMYEMQALRAQMNPHFIFNSLNSIKSFIARKEPRRASEYLNKFSKLIRLILHNSTMNQIPLKEELEALELYLEIENLRLENAFSYGINCDETLNECLIPPLILQPYAENAIWHGLIRKKDDRQLNINIIKKEQGQIMISVRDNGIGRVAAKKDRNGLSHKSKGMAITKNRISLTNKNEEFESVKIVDHEDGQGKSLGTEVLISLDLI